MHSVINSEKNRNCFRVIFLQVVWWHGTESLPILTASFSYWYPCPALSQTPLLFFSLSIWSCTSSYEQFFIFSSDIFVLSSGSLSDYCYAYSFHCIYLQVHCIYLQIHCIYLQIIISAFITLMKYNFPYVPSLVGNISGRVKITVMDGMRIWHSGIVLNLEQYLHYLDPFVSSDLCAREMRVTVDTDTSGTVSTDTNSLFLILWFDSVFHFSLIGGFF